MIRINHIALQYPNSGLAHEFFVGVLGCAPIKAFSISPKLSRSLFGIEKEVRAESFSNGDMTFEIFFAQKGLKQGYEHICIEVPDINEIFASCRKLGIKTIVAQKDGRELYFIRDKAGYLYEIKAVSEAPDG